jgi:hypothetical protein
MNGIGNMVDSRFEIRDLGFEIRDSRLAKAPISWHWKSFFILLSLLFFQAAGWSQDVQVTASVDSDTVGVQDQFQLTITVTGSDSDTAEPPRALAIPGFKIVAGPNVSSQFQWINGRSSSNKSFIYILLPEKEGQFALGPVEVRVNGKSYKTQKLLLRVTASSGNRPSRRQRSPNPFDPFEEETMPESRSRGNAIFIRAELDKTSVYPGQQVTLSYRLYTQVSIQGIQLQENPPLSGFWVEDMDVDKIPRGQPQIVNGQEYQAFTIKRQALFATTTGRLKIPSSVIAVSARTEGDFFGVFGRTETLYRKTQEVFLEVKPLPVAGRPANFQNAVGTFNLNAGIDKSEVAAGDAVALRLKLSGQGNLKMIPDIPLPNLPDFTTYSSKHTDSVRPGEAYQIGGEKNWEYVLVPKSPGRYTIPALSFSYFNAAQGKYETVSTSPLALHVLPGKENQAFSTLSGGSKQNLVRRGTDINYLKPLQGKLTQNTHPWYLPLWIYLLCAIILAGNIGMFFRQKQHSLLAENPINLRNRKAKRNALNRLKTAEKEGAKDSRLFYDHAATALAGYLADRFNLMEIELTGDNLERMLAIYKVPEETVKETRTCLEACDFGRFVSAAASAEQMQTLSDRIRINIDALEMAEVIVNSQSLNKMRTEA